MVGKGSQNLKMLTQHSLGNGYGVIEREALCKMVRDSKYGGDWWMGLFGGKRCLWCDLWKNIRMVEGSFLNIVGGGWF